MTKLRSIAILLWALPALAQNSTTGSITGVITDASGAAVPGVEVTATNDATGATETATSNGQGTYIVALLAPGSYHISAAKAGFSVSTYEHITVVVTEAATVNVQLNVGAQTQRVTVAANQNPLQTQDAQLGIVTSSQTIEALPLVTRNFMQIAALEPGVSSTVTDASALGRGALSNEEGSGGISSNGSNTNDNNFQINGVEVNDLMGAGTFSGGVPTPNPDTLEEFKVVTAPYDASNGRNAGAQVNVLTKGGSNNFHGNLYEFFRNDDLNANSFSNNQVGAPRGVLRQNQYGGTLGGPIIKDKLLFFGSYQGTNQLNGIASGCAVTTLLPPLTNDRSAAALGALFGGQRGYFQTAVLPGGPVGPAIAANGSNINPVALAVLQAKLPNGQYIIPSPQKITPTTLSPSNPLYAQAFSEEGASVFSQACPFTEKQFEANVDYIMSSKSQLSERFFFSNDSQTQTLFQTTLPGFPYPTVNTFRDFALIWTYTFNSHLVNQAEAGYHRSTQAQSQQYPPAASSYGQFGIALPPFSTQPKIEIADAVVGGYGQSYNFAQNNYILSDSLTWSLGRHTLHFGGNATKSQINESNFQYAPPVVFETFADFLLGQNAAQNGTAAACVALGCSPGYSDVAESIYLGGQTDRAYRVVEGGAYVQDDFKVSRKLTLNLGFRYDRLGQIGDASGHNVAFFPYLANPNPPATGSLQGFVVPSNYTGPPLPAGVTRGNNDFGTLGYGQNTFDPRVGFAWVLPRTERVVLRGGYGTFHSRSTAIALFQGFSSPPFATISQVSGTQTAGFTDANPFAPDTVTLPAFQSYSPSTNNTYAGYAPNFRFPLTQRWSADVQTKLANKFVLDIGYVGSKFTNETVFTQTNQAALASASNPIRGVTTSTVGNIPLRVPIEGFNVNGISLYEPLGHGTYNSLQISLNKQFSHGLQFLLSYTYARDLTNAIGTARAEEAGTFIGNQLAPASGPDPFVRPHRFVLS
ncbi:MAG TPA: TonB-dependent receptor [Bryobacteraceae bacterium]|nr:TonB-dependent receptor [Bryobacteraceae bacterium]